MTIIWLVGWLVGWNNDADNLVVWLVGWLVGFQPAFIYLFISQHPVSWNGLWWAFCFEALKCIDL
jgi:hypothetical protein